MWPELLPKTPPDKKAKYLLRIMEDKERTEYMVDTMIESQPMYTGELNPHWKYWNDVKQELEKL